MHSHHEQVYYYELCRPNKNSESFPRNLWRLPVELV